MHLPLSASLTNGETSSGYFWLWTPMVRNCTCPRMDLYLPTSPSIISRKLKELKLIVLDFASSPPPDIDSPDPNNTSLARNIKELEIQKIVYQYSYKKVRQRYQKRGPKILKQYNEINNHLIENGGVVQKDIELLTLTHLCLETIDIILKDETPRDLEVTRLIKSIAALSGAWKKNLDEDESLLTHWDNLTYVIKNRHLSLRRFLEKLITLHHHIQTILRIAWSRPLFHFLDGSFDVVPILAVPSKFSLVFSELQVQNAAFSEG